LKNWLSSLSYKEEVKLKINDFDQIGFGTMNIHSGSAKNSEGALAVPIYQTSTFCFDTVEQGTAIFAKEIPGYAYSRGGNPTTAALQEKIAALEKGEACVATASGMGAIGAVLIEFLKAGDHMICGECVYGCTDVVVRNTLTKFGVEVSFVDTSDLDAVKSAIKENTTMIYFETPTNPTMQITNIAAIAQIAKEKEIKVVVDNTFAPPPVQYPLQEGADIVVHSITKYINGHGDVIGGAVIGNAEDMGRVAANSSSKICGTTPSPFNSYLVIRGLQTMELRMERHCKNGLAVAKYLEQNPMVDKVYYPGLESNPQYELAKRQMNGLFGGILAFELKDGINGMSSYDACKKLLNELKLASIAVSLGDPGTLIQHPASMTHANVKKEDQLAAGISQGLIRLSAGLENTEDIIADFEQAFKKLAES
jgi:methionine-gamma-lyase